MAFLNFYCNNNQDWVTTTYLGHNDTVKYVGKEACKNCHPAIYASFLETGMGKSFGPATRSRTSAQFTRASVVFDAVKNLWYFPHWIGDSMYLTEFRLKGGDTVYKRIERVDYIIGSGQHTNSHLGSVNGYVYQMPFTWYSQKGTWDLPPGFEQGRNMRFGRAIEMECMSCHNAMPVTESGSPNRFVKIPDGIDCERCHGPGEVHVREKLLGHFVDTAKHIDYTIVNPRKLSWERQIDVCQRCHLQGNAVLRPGKSFADFKPGMILSDVMEVFMPRYEGNDDAFIMASHAQRLQLSKCFIASNRIEKQPGGSEFQSLHLTCVTCHNPHVSVRKTDKAVFNQACLKCHAVADCNEKVADRHLVDDQCVSCHMPRSGSVDIPHVSVHDHKIGIHRKQPLKDKSNKFAGIYSVNSNNPSVQAQVMAWLQYREKFEGPETSIDSATNLIRSLDGALEMKIHAAYLRGDWIGIQKLATKDNWKISGNAWMYYRIGQAYQNLGNYALAQEAFELALEGAPTNLDFLNKLAIVTIQLGDFQEGIALLEKSLNLHPKQAEVWVNLGYAKLNRNDIQGSLVAYNKALSLDPDNTQALLNRAALFNLRGDKQKAIQDLNRLLQIDPTQAEVKKLLAKMHSE